MFSCHFCVDERESSRIHLVGVFGDLEGDGLGRVKMKKSKEAFIKGLTVIHNPSGELLTELLKRKRTLVRATSGAKAVKRPKEK